MCNTVPLIAELDLHWHDGRAELLPFFRLGLLPKRTLKDADDDLLSIIPEVLKLMSQPEKFVVREVGNPCWAHHVKKQALGLARRRTERVADCLDCDDSSIAPAFVHWLL